MNLGTAQVIRANSRHLPLTDALRDPAKDLVEGFAVVGLRNLGQRVSRAVEVRARRVHQQVHGIPQALVARVRRFKHVIGRAIEGRHDLVVSVCLHGGIVA